MTITEHKRLVAAIPEDLKEGEEIEVRTSDGEWRREKFALYFSPKRECEYIHGVMDMDGVVWPYVRRPAAAQKKRLKDEPWPDGGWRWRAVDQYGSASYFLCTPDIDESCGWWYDSRGGYAPLQTPTIYDSTDWQNSLERRPE